MVANAATVTPAGHEAAELRFRNRLILGLGLSTVALLGLSYAQRKAWRDFFLECSTVGALEQVGADSFAGGLRRYLYANGIKIVKIDNSGQPLQFPAALLRLPCLTTLHLTNAALDTLPTSIAQLTTLRLGNCTALESLGLKSNSLQELPASIGRLHSLHSLYLTDNELTTLPIAMSHLTSLVKLQASFNRLASLPEGLACLRRLQLMRVAVNKLQEVPASFSCLQSLAWFSLAGNPACPAPLLARAEIAQVKPEEVELGQCLGEGASGEVFAARWGGRDVAVKVFKAETSPDGRAVDEIAVTCCIDHPNLIRVLGHMAKPHALVLRLVQGAPMAEKPTVQSLLRCRWAPGSLAGEFVVRAAAGVAAALEHLHAHHICHGDVYAHNCLADKDGNVTLCDYGASFFYQPNTVPYEKHEVLAYGIMLGDMVARLEPNSSFHAELQQLHCACTSRPAISRPSFGEVSKQLAQLIAKLPR
ncbi:hypothetical protein WJX72_006238 [[Myrmecia] bisecta]|uniref:Protein kinase domain-containing protein n=1 Tax=[Myrmecia] bisecta TaxID=41462 RepID=A0AAW1PUJ9_9CHLO